ncbi:hypothetical protein K502DRAFT_367634 [Neoconidiobolus thromboides FSU 785]|nr:hypothetical protein K502DRAFT_367634 [Neoconidiobolus thromboides FSU 785]
MPSSTNCGNPLFLKFVEEWLIEARCNGSRSKFVYQKAYDSLLNCPTVLNAEETVQLNGIGPNIAAKLARKLEEHKIKERDELNNEAEVIDFTVNDNEQQNQGEVTERSDTVIKKKQKTKSNQIDKDNRILALLPKKILGRESNRKTKSKEYIPTYRSGGYAILIALYKLHQRESNLSEKYSKQQIIQIANQHCNVPLDKLLHGQAYTGWSSIKQLIKHDLVYIVQRPVFCSLTEAGWDLAKRLILAEKEINYNMNTESEINRNTVIRETTDRDDMNSIDKTINSRVETRDNERIDIELNSRTKDVENTVIGVNSNSNQDKIISNITNEIFKEFELKKQDYYITLLLDSREIMSVKDRDYFEIGLNRRGVKLEKRNLSLGDFLWVAKPKTGCSGPEEEIVLDFIVERKRYDDLFASIKDGRFKEQKSRLKSCGLSKIIYLIEGFNINDINNVTIPYNQIVTSICKTIIKEGFIIKITKDLEESLNYLASLTQKIISSYESRDLVGTNILLDDKKSNYKLSNLNLSYQSFHTLTSKSSQITIQTYFIKMLLSVKGCSLKRALIIIKSYPTPASLLNEYNQNDTKNNELLLVNNSKDLASRVTPILSKRIHSFFCNK